MLSRTETRASRSRRLALSSKQEGDDELGKRKRGISLWRDASGTFAGLLASLSFPAPARLVCPSLVQTLPALALDEFLDLGLVVELDPPAQLVGEVSEASDLAIGERDLTVLPRTAMHDLPQPILESVHPSGTERLFGDLGHFAGQRSPI